MLRVLGTIKNSPYNTSMQSEQIDLVDWITEIHDGMYKNLVSHINFLLAFLHPYIICICLLTLLPTSHVFRNYANQPLLVTNFYDAASTALMVSTVYRLSILAGVDTYIPQAENSRKALSTGSSGGSGGVAAVDEY